MLTWSACASAMRLPSKERRQAIVTAVKGAFAAKGFDGTTTRELARAAGVSEALLYKHFPSKESLYGAMLDACVEGPVAAEWGRVLTLPPSTSTLVVLVHLLTAHFVQCDDLQKTTMHRLALRSLLEDADFARLGAKQFGASWVRKVEACIKAAVKAGDLKATHGRVGPPGVVRPPSGVRADGPPPPQGAGDRLRNLSVRAGRPSSVVPSPGDGLGGGSDPTPLSPRGAVASRLVMRPKPQES